jgi:hypothetical protein
MRPAFFMHHRRYKTHGFAPTGLLVELFDAAAFTRGGGVFAGQMSPAVPRASVDIHSKFLDMKYP